jgi:nitroreductase
MTSASQTRALAQLLERRSVPARLLGEPGPDPAQLQAMLAAAVRVPDHGRLTPWRFLRIQGAARDALGELLVRLTRERAPDSPESALDKERRRFSHAPLVIVVIATPLVGHKVPEIEQLLSGGSVCFGLLQAAQALGFGAQWLTGWAAYDAQVQAALGLEPGERILGFIHVGTPREPAPGRERPDPLQRLQDWAP